MSDQVRFTDSLKAPSRGFYIAQCSSGGYFVSNPKVGGFGCLELCIYQYGMTSVIEFIMIKMMMMMMMMIMIMINRSAGQVPALFPLLPSHR